MNVLALEPYHGGSHRAFLDGWSRRSRHTWTVLGLPAYKWKWRMRHGALALAGEVAERWMRGGERWEVLFCSDMLDLAAWYGLAPVELRSLPAVAYFHENQLTYPVRHESERDYHFGYTNMTTALAARAVWFNSAFNRDSFLGALPKFLARMPDYQPADAVERILAKASVWPQGIAPQPARGERAAGPMRVLWAARWEHDKQPEAFFSAMERVAKRGVDFRLSVVGERFRDVPAVFDAARERFAGRIERWGYQPTREAYEAALREADVVVSTAAHEFFGISVAEAVAAGAFPIVPRRLAYPELLAGLLESIEARVFYDGGVDELTVRLLDAADRIKQGTLWDGESDAGVRAMRAFLWPELAPRLDGALEEVAVG